MASSLDGGSHVLFVCEGTCEQVLVDILRRADLFVMPSENIVDVTRFRKASQIQDAYLNLDYDWPLTIVRVVDSLKERFKLGNLYRDSFEVVNVHTRPEVEILLIINEGRYSDFMKYKSKLKPSEYCIQKLGMSKVKSASFLESYWDAKSLCKAAREYKRLHKFEAGEICLTDILSI